MAEGLARRLERRETDRGYWRREEARVGSRSLSNWERGYRGKGIEGSGGRGIEGGRLGGGQSCEMKEIRLEE